MYAVILATIFIEAAANRATAANRSYEMPFQLYDRRTIQSLVDR
jgi:hypothetical protein